MIDNICRIYLWSGSTISSWKYLVSWDKICFPKVAGGLNIMNLKLWNNVVILKLLWIIDHKNDS